MGYNTDILGFEKSIKPHLQPMHQKALIFGSGGASLAVQFVFKKLGIEFVLVSRNPGVNQIAYPQLTQEMLSTYLIWVNCTPLGMYPNLQDCPPINFEACGPNHLVYDLIYNPSKTHFLKKSESQRASILNGLEMLHIQALESAKIFGLLEN
jgi:shikimate dehydrogenase